MQRIERGNSKPRIAMQQFETFRREEVEAEGQDSERERGHLLARIRQLQEEISQTNDRASHLETLNGRLNQIIVNYHTKSSSRLDHFLERVNQIVDKRSNTNRSTDRKVCQTIGNELKMNKSSSIKKMSNVDDFSSFGKVKTQQTASISDENNSFIGNLCNPISRHDLKKKLASKLSSTIAK